MTRRGAKGTKRGCCQPPLLRYRGFGERIERIGGWERGARKGGRRGGRGITEGTEGSEYTERGFSDFSGVSGSVDAQIDGLVYGLHGLTEEEVGVVEGRLNHE